MDVSVVTSGHDVADARLHREVAALQRFGLRVEVLGLGRSAAGPSGALVRTVRRRGAARRALLAVDLARRARGGVLLTLDPDSALAAAAVCRARYGRRRLVVDVHEDYAALLQDRPWARLWGGIPGLVGTAVVTGFQAVARRADLTVVADDHVPPLTARHRFVLRNLPDLRQLPAPAPPEVTPRALYVGDVRASRGLFAMLSTMRLLPAWTLDIVGPVAAPDQPRLEDELTRGGLADRVRMHGRLPPERAWALAPGAWVGFLLLDDTPAFSDALPSKLWEYLACGVPVVATDLRRQGAAVRESGSGIVVPAADESSVAAATAVALRGWQDDDDGYRAARRAALVTGRSMAEEAGYDDFARSVRALVCAFDAIA